MAWFLYLLECSDGSIYTGIATDVQARFDKHASGAGARYTRSRKPVRVLASFELANRSGASKAEYWVKRLTAVDKRALAAGLSRSASRSASRRLPRRSSSRPALPEEAGFLRFGLVLVLVSACASASVAHTSVLLCS
jgi:putative endonuclease